MLTGKIWCGSSAPISHWTDLLHICQVLSFTIWQNVTDISLGISKGKWCHLSLLLHIAIPWLLVYQCISCLTTLQLFKYQHLWMLSFPSVSFSDQWVSGSLQFITRAFHIFILEKNAIKYIIINNNFIASSPLNQACFVHLMLDSSQHKTWNNSLSNCNFL